MITLIAVVFSLAAVLAAVLILTFHYIGKDYK